MHSQYPPESLVPMMILILIRPGKTPGSGFPYWRPCSSSFGPASCSSHGRVFIFRHKHAAASCRFKRRMLPLQRRMGNHRQPFHHSCLFKRENNAPLLWEKGGLDADPQRVNPGCGMPEFPYREEQKKNEKSACALEANVRAFSAFCSQWIAACSTDANRLTNRNAPKIPSVAVGQNTQLNFNLGVFKVIFFIKKRPLK